MGKTIGRLPIDDRPYEKLEILGSENLSNSELLAIIIKTGKKGLNCVEIAQNILGGYDKTTHITDLLYLNSLSKNELMKYDGIGRVKAIQIQAVLELAKRINRSILNTNKIKINTPLDVYNLLKESYLNKKQEIIKTILLDKSNNVICVVTNTLGNVSSASTTVKEIFSEPIKQLASYIILVHNHPSGNVNPSKQDIKFTNNMMECGKTFGVTVLDHIIIGKSGYTSLKESNYM